MKTSLRSILVVMLICMLLFAFALPCLAAQNVVSGQKVGVGGLTVKGGLVKVQTIAGVDKITMDHATGNFFTAGSISGAYLRPIATRISTQTPTLTVAAYPSGSVIVCTHVTPTVTLPAVATSAGVTYTIVNGGAGTTSFTIAAATACVLSSGAATGNGSATTTSLIWSAAGRIVGVTATFVCDGTNWIMISSNYQATTLT